jgi:alpha-beta hydrolase superfamily lysophospholipase
MGGRDGRRERRYRGVLAAVAAFVAVSCAGAPTTRPGSEFAGTPSAMLGRTSAADAAAPRPVPSREQLGLLGLLGDRWIYAEEAAALADGPAFPDGALSAYRSYFGFGPGLGARGLDGPKGRLFLTRLAAQGERKGVALLIHGYRAHGGHFAPFAELVADSGWDCYLLDLPGHGLSEGERFGIGDFDDYGRATLAAIEAIRDWESSSAVADPTQVYSGGPPLVLIGHSTGCSAIIEAFRLSAAQGDPPPADGVVFAAPLVDMPNKRIRGALNAVAGERLLELPGFAASPALIGPGVACNPAYREFIARGDPLSDWVYHTSWLNSYLDWYDGLVESRPIVFDGPALVVQGTGDTVVNWRGSQELLDRMFPARDTRFYESYSHTILNAAPERLARVFSDIAAFLAGLAVR